jgi:hypothetical protein
VWFRWQIAPQLWRLRHTCGGGSTTKLGISVAVDLGRRMSMLYTLAVILLIAWLLGVVGTYTIGSFVHVLLVIALVLFLVQLISGRRTVV